MTVGTVICLSCRQNFHTECNYPEPCCCNTNTATALVSPGSPEQGLIKPQIAVPAGGFATAEEYYAMFNLKDPHSTGRKRAKEAFPLDYDAPCEWQFLKFAGGGEFPIVGCANGKQKSRHHGPNKGTLINEVGNVHRCCHDCHNVWHGINDPGYIWGDHIIRTPHDSQTRATPQELAEEALRRSKGTKNITRNQGD